MANPEITSEVLRDKALTEKAGKASKMIWVTFQKEGMHKYPAALDDPKLKRASLDYSDLTDVLVHHSIRDCLDTLSVKQPYMVTPRTNQIYTQVAFSPGDAIMFGPESIGFKEDFLNTFDEELHISIPMAPSNRSLNLANAVSIVLYEAWRQCNFYTT